MNLEVGKIYKYIGEDLDYAFGKIGGTDIPFKRLDKDTTVRIRGISDKSITLRFYESYNPRYGIFDMYHDEEIPLKCVKGKEELFEPVNPDKIFLVRTKK